MFGFICFSFQQFLDYLDGLFLTKNGNGLAQVVDVKLLWKEGSIVADAEVLWKSEEKSEYLEFVPMDIR